MAQPEALSLAGGGWRSRRLRPPAGAAGKDTAAGLARCCGSAARTRSPCLHRIRAHEPDRLRPYLLPGALDPFAALAFTSRSGIAPSPAPSPPPPPPPSFPSPTPPPRSPSPWRHSAATPTSWTAPSLPGSAATPGGWPSSSRTSPPPPASWRRWGAGPAAACSALSPTSTAPRAARRARLPRPARRGRVDGRARAGVHHVLGRPGLRERLVAPDAAAPDAIVFTSSAEVEGLLKGLDAAGWSWPRLRARWPDMVVAAHGPVTAEGVRRLGIEVDVVSSRFSSFHGVLDALAATFCSQQFKISSRFSAGSH
uniref:Tetrapyrrole biosynthesis uroporphyrinogen III synthase domain-containing protein n=1 Tax=Triticum urartu TaxID=4572 RepID=A0A8R7QDR1_TRIUA